MQLARLNMGRKHFAPFALATTVAVILAIDHVTEVLKLGGIARDAKLLVDTARRRGGTVLPGERMAGAAVSKHAAPQALERTATAEQQARVLTLALDQKCQECLVQDTLTGMGLNAIDGTERFASRGIDRHDLGARAALVTLPSCATARK